VRVKEIISDSLQRESKKLCQKKNHSVTYRLTIGLIVYHPGVKVNKEYI